MITKVTSVNKLREMFINIFLTNTNNVTKVSPNSVVSANAFGVAKLSQKILTDIAVLESEVFPESATGANLDSIALREGYPARFGASNSSTYLRLVGNPGTTYNPSMVFSGSHGKTFHLLTNAVIGADGFTYAKVISVETGNESNVEPLTINTVTPPPAGHKYVINEVRAEGGRNAEDDETFRRRLMSGPNILAQGTLDSYLQMMMKLNGRVLRLIKGGINAVGNLVIYVVGVDGVDFAPAELQYLQSQLVPSLSMTDQYAGVELRNAYWFPIDVTFRCSLKSGYNPADFRVAVQIGMQKLFDLKTWDIYRKVEWDDLFYVLKSTPGLDILLDDWFFPNEDLYPPLYHLPRIRSFIMMDLNGVIISQGSGNLNPSYYPNNPDYIYQQTVLMQI